MDEPFTGLDPVNLGILREAFLELRDQGRTLIFSTHQMEAAEALCESRRHRRPRPARRRWHGRRPQAGQRASHAPARRRRRGGAGLARRPARGRPRSGPGPATSSSSWTPGASRRRSSPPSSRAAPAVTRFEVAEPCLEAIFIEHVGRSPEDAIPATAGLAEPSGPQPTPGSPDDRRIGRAPRPAPAERRDRRPARVPRPRAQPALPRLDDPPDGPGPRGRDSPRSRSATWTARPSPGSPSSPTTRSSAIRAIAVTDSLLNTPPGGVDAAAWEKPYLVELATDLPAANAALGRGDLGGIMIVGAAAERPARRHVPDRGPGGRRPQPARRVRGVRGRHPRLDRDPAAGLAARAVPDAALPHRVDERADRGRSPVDPQEAASRGFLGIVFVVLLFMTVIIYGMWVATGVAAEKSSRVMELMISAASPRQLLTGKVVGIGAAGLTQYVAIAVPALVVVALPGSDRRRGPRADRGRSRPDRRADPGPAAWLRRLLPARVHAVRADLRGDGLVREPAGRPPDAVAAAQPAGDGRAT